MSIKFISANLNRSLQAALSICCNYFADCRSKKSSWCKIALWPSFCQRHLNLGNYTATCLWNQIKFTKAQKQCRGLTSKEA